MVMKQELPVNWDSLLQWRLPREDRNRMWEGPSVSSARGSLRIRCFTSGGAR